MDTQKARETPRLKNALLANPDSIPPTAETQNHKPESSYRHGGWLWNKGNVAVHNLREKEKKLLFVKASVAVVCPLGFTRRTGAVV